MKKVKIGIVGLGRMGRIHLENVNTKFPDAEVVAISDIADEARDLAESHDVQYYRDFSDLVQDDRVEAVVICSPTDRHAENIIEAAKAGKDIFCEKPMDLSLERVKEVLKVIQESGGRFMLGFNRRFDPNFRKIKERIDRGEIGDPHIIKITSRDPGPPPVSYIKSSGGMFLDMSIHDFDMARFMSGSEVEDVFAFGKNLVDDEIAKAGDIDTAVITLSFANGAIATIDNSRKAVYGYDQRVEVFGSKGMAGTENNTGDNHYYYDEKGRHSALPLHFFMDRYVPSYYYEMRSFVDCLLNNKEPEVAGFDGLMSLAIGLAANLSVKEGRAVRVSEILPG